MSGGHLVFAQNAEVDSLNSEISNKKSEIDSINSKMDTYKKKIQELSSKSANLRNDIELIENQTALAKLDIEATRANIKKQQLEIEEIDKQITEETATIENQKAMLEEMLFELHKSDKIGLVQVLFSSQDFNQMFTEIENLESVNKGLNKALTTSKAAKDGLETNKAGRQERLDGLVSLEADLKQKINTLTANEEAKNTLIAETQSSEAEYRIMMSELRQEQQYITTQISKLQAEIEAKIRNSDNSADLGDPGVFIDPVPSAVTTAIFHDPTYPFRNLFEHSGHDLAAPTGTPIRASAPGVVAWTKRGRDYGNYVIIIHEGGFSTLYAHMSAFNVKQDQFVARGDIIGYVGSTGFSTGPHLHFEVRLNGIPVDPRNYVPGLK